MSGLFPCAAPTDAAARADRIAHVKRRLAWESLGHATAAYEMAVTYATERIQFGKPIASYQLVQNKLANMLADLSAMQLICFRTP